MVTSTICCITLAYQKLLFVFSRVKILHFATLKTFVSLDSTFYNYTITNYVLCARFCFTRNICTVFDDHED